MEDLIFYLFLANATLHLGQTLVYGFKEHNRPTILFGSVFIFLAFNFTKDVSWIPWATLIVPATGFIAVLTGFRESHKPNWLNYTMMLLNLILSVLAIINLL